MIGIKSIGVYIPKNTRSNFALKDKFEIDDYFISNKIGFERVAVKSLEENTSDLCVNAYKNLLEKVQIEKESIDALVVVTQNPDSNIPHVSAVVHGELNMPETCACFDISLGCSGYVYGLSVLEGLMKNRGFKRALLFTADPYSKIINQEDKNTFLLFGDAATATLLSDDPVFICADYTFGTAGKQSEHLTCKDNKLYMNGRAIFEFAARYVPKDVNVLLERNRLELNEIDLFLFHQGSKYIVDTLTKRMKLTEQKVPFGAAQYGNTVSSSIPILLEQYINNVSIKSIILSGFGVGLSWASTLLRRV